HCGVLIILLFYIVALHHSVSTLFPYTTLFRSRYDAMDAQMAADLVGMARPVTKWATMVLDPSSLLRVLRRAIKIAATPPMGPVYICLPQDILDAPMVEEVRPTSFPSTRVVPDAASLHAVAAILAQAHTPMIVV